MGVLNVAPENIAVRYQDHNHEERVTTPTLDAQKLYLTEAPSKFEIQVRCQQSNQQCNLVQMELLQALRDRKTEFNTALRKYSGKETAYVSASGMPAVTSLSENFDQLEGGEDAASATNVFLMLVAGMAMTTLGFVTFFKMSKRSSSGRMPVGDSQDFSRRPLNQENNEEELNQLNAVE